MTDKPKEIIIKRESVTSSNLDEVGYDKPSQILEIKFLKTGDVYRYFGVPSSVHQSLMSAVSIGKAFYPLVKNAGYQCEKLT